MWASSPEFQRLEGVFKIIMWVNVITSRRRTVLETRATRIANLDGKVPVSFVTFRLQTLPSNTALFKNAYICDKSSNLALAN